MHLWQLIFYLFCVLFGVLLKIITLKRADEERRINFWKNRIVIGHRGVRNEAPENTILAFHKAKELGVQIIDIDVQVTKDDTPVILNPADLSQISNTSGLIYNFDIKQLKGVRVNGYYGKERRYMEDKIPTLEEALTTAKNLDLRINLDIKNLSGIQSTLAVYQKQPAFYNSTMFCSTSFWISYIIKWTDSRAMNCLAWRSGYYTYTNGSLRQSLFKSFYDPRFWLAKTQEIVYDWLFFNVIWWFSGLDSIMIDSHSISKNLLNLWEIRKMPVMAFVVNDHYEKLYLYKSLRCPFVSDSVSDLEIGK